MKSSVPVELILALMFKHLLRETYSSDALYMAMAGAKGEAEEMLIDPAEFERVMVGVLRHWQTTPNPMRSALFT